MPKVYVMGSSVFDAAKQRIRDELLAGNRVVVSSSGGKDSTICTELTVIVARELGMLPIDVIMRDEEIMAPGTFEYMERVGQRTKEINLRWIIAGQPIINAYNRFNPYWWVFDPLEKDKWVRQPPAWAEWVEEQNIEAMTIRKRYPTPDDKRLISVIGLRAQESLVRMNRIASTGGALTKHPTHYGTYNLAPIYDWTTDDVWRAIREFKWDYNHAYDALYRIGVPKEKMRIAPPSMKQGMNLLKYLQRLWPFWYEKVETRLPGMRAAAYYGARALRPYLKKGETWDQCYDRLMQESANAGAQWLVDRMEITRTQTLKRHTHHSSVYPMTRAKGCSLCVPVHPGSWEDLCRTMYNGDPWSHYNQGLPPLEPFALREGAKGWFEDGKAGAALHW